MNRIHFGTLENVELNQNWGILPDPMDRAVAQKWWKSFRKENYFFPSYDDDAFWPTAVPGAYNRVHPELAYYEGPVVYLLHFQAEKPSPEERVFLHFEGVSERCRVFLNGRYLGEQDGGHVPFTFEISSVLAEENRLLVYANATRSPETVPGTIHDWRHEAGIIRPVRIYRRPKEYLRDCGVSVELTGDEVRLHLRFLPEGATREKRNLTWKISEEKTSSVLAEGTLSVPSGSWTETVVSLPADKVHLWSCEAPFLYQLEVRCGTDHWCDLTGLREIRTEGHDILLNGKKIILRGAAAWAEDPVRGLFSLGKETAERTVGRLKELNCNFARAGHRPNSMEFVRACDRAGILLWTEVPAYWLPDMQKPVRSRIALQCLEESIRFFRNNPSVILWSIGNECLYHDAEGAQSNLAYFEEAADKVHELDPSRLVTYTGGMEGAGKEDHVAKICPQEIVDKLDVVGINSYSGINDDADGPGTPHEFPMQHEKILLASAWGKPLILAEAGIDAVRGEKGFDFGEDRQKAYHEKLQKLFAEEVAAGRLQGLSVFVLNDFPTPIKRGRYQKGFNRKGLLDDQNVPKKAFYIVQKGFGELKERG